LASGNTLLSLHPPTLTIFFTFFSPKKFESS
jgi:hypothetical protein